MAGMVVAAAQLGPADEDKARNVDRILTLLAQARKENVDLVTLPELSLTPYFCLAPEPWHGNADGPDSVHLQRVAQAAKELQLHVVLPLAEQGEAGCYNAAAIIDADGTVIGWQRKVHLPSAEQRHFSAGREFGINKAAGCNVGILICADRGFPESWRVLGVLGAQVVCAPYNTSTRQAHGCPPGVSELEWARDLQTTRMRAAAMASGFYVIAAGKGGRERDIDYIADSMIISPWGEVIRRATSSGDELVTAEVDLEEVARFRQGGRYARRVPSAYAPITAPIAEWIGEPAPTG